MQRPATWQRGNALKVEKEEEEGNECNKVQKVTDEEEEENHERFNQFLIYGYLLLITNRKKYLCSLIPTFTAVLFLSLPPSLSVCGE